MQMFANSDNICHACSKKGHLAKKCRSSKGNGKPGQGKAQAHVATHHVEEDDEEATLPTTCLEWK